MQPWKTVSKRTILNHSKYLVVEEHTIELPDGQMITSWPWLIKPDYAIILAITQEGKYLCFRQVKYAVQGTSLAPVGGYLEPGEEPLATAQRELLEETGYQAKEWIDLGHYVVDGNNGAGFAHLYLARNAMKIEEPQEKDQEEQELLEMSRNEVEAALAAGEFKVLAWAATVAMALCWMER